MDDWMDERTEAGIDELIYRSMIR